MESVKPKVKPYQEPVKQYSGQYKTANEYAEALRLWMVQMYQMQCIHSSFPFFLANLQAQSSQGSAGSRTSGTPQVTTATTTTTTTTSVPRRVNQNQQQRQQETPRQGIEYSVPSFWKRFVAEMIDFFLLFIIKLGVTYIAVDAFDLLEGVDKYGFETLSTELLTDYKTALSMTSNILLLEFIHRIGTCVFEAMFLRKGPAGLGGATPGKKMMGLKVVRCEYAAPAVGDRVIVYPATDLGMRRAFLRAVVKNLSLTFFFPVCFTVFSFQHSRTIYDFFAGSIVVEDRARPLDNR